MASHLTVFAKLSHQAVPWNLEYFPRRPLALSLSLYVLARALGFGPVSTSRGPSFPFRLLIRPRAHPAASYSAQHADLIARERKYHNIIIVIPPNEKFSFSTSEIISIFFHSHNTQVRCKGYRVGLL